MLPINGLGHAPVGDTTGWYLWAGEELSSDPDFFVPLHLKHLDDWRPGLARYLGLAPGWRFLIDPAAEHEDVWEDPSLLEGRLNVAPSDSGLAILTMGAIGPLARGRTWMPCTSG